MTPREIALDQLGKWWPSDEVLVAMDLFEEQGFYPKLHTVEAPHNNTHAVVVPLTWAVTDTRRADGSGGLVYNPLSVQMVFSTPILPPGPRVEGEMAELVVTRVQMDMAQEDSEFVFRNLDQICESPPDPQKLTEPFIPRGWFRRALLERELSRPQPLQVDSWLPGL